jgi:hypothetical protein
LLIAYHRQDADSEADDQPTGDEHTNVDCTSLERGTDHTASSAHHHGFLPSPGVIHGGGDAGTDGRTGLQHSDDASDQGRAGALEVCEEQFLSDGVGDDTLGQKSVKFDDCVRLGHRERRRMDSLTAVISEHQTGDTCHPGTQHHEPKAP